MGVTVLRPLLLALLLLAVAAPAAGAATFPDFPHTKITVGKGMGGITVGQEHTSALAAWNAAATASQCGSDGCIWTDNANRVQTGSTGRMRINWRDDAITSIYLEAGKKKSVLNTFKTSKGVRLGTKVKQLKKKYGKKLTKSPALAGMYEIRGAVKTQFVTNGKRVTGIYLTIY